MIYWPHNPNTVISGLEKKKKKTHMTVAKMLMIKNEKSSHKHESGFVYLLWNPENTTSSLPLKLRKNEKTLPRIKLGYFWCKKINWNFFRPGNFSSFQLKLEYIGTERLPYRCVALHVISWSQIHLFVTHVYFLHLPDLLLIQSVFLLHFPELLSTTPRELAWPLAYTFIYRCSEQYSILITILRAEARFPSLTCFFNSQEQHRVFWSCWQNWRRGRQFKGLS